MWTIRALNQGDLITAFNDIQDDGSAALGKMSTLVLSQIAYAIDAMDGVPVYEWFPDLIKRAEFNTTEEFKMAVRRIVRRYLEKMPADILKEFDNAYATIEKKRNEAIAELKKS